jgi:hypothetical protein
MFNEMDAIVWRILRIGMFGGHDDEIALHGERDELTREAGCVTRELTDLWHGMSPVLVDLA